MDRQYCPACGATVDGGCCSSMCERVMDAEREQEQDDADEIELPKLCWF